MARFILIAVLAILITVLALANASKMDITERTQEVKAALDANREKAALTGAASDAMKKAMDSKTMAVLARRASAVDKTDLRAKTLGRRVALEEARVSRQERGDKTRTISE